MIQRPDNNFFKSMTFLLILISFVLALCFMEPRAEENNMTDYAYTYVTMKETEFDEFVRVMYLECRGEPFEGKVAVAETIYNRVLSEYFPDTVHDVLSQRGQFSTWHHISKVDSIMECNKAEVINEIREAIKYVADNGITVLPSADYVYFDTSGKNGRKHIQIGNHFFGKLNK